MLQDAKQKISQKKKDDDDRAHNRPVTAVSQAEQRENKSFWSNLSSTPCFLPAVTDVDGDSDEAIRGSTAYSKPPHSSSTTNAFMSGESSLRNRAFVSKSSNA